MARGSAGAGRAARAARPADARPHLPSRHTLFTACSSPRSPPVYYMFGLDTWRRRGPAYHYAIAASAAAASGGGRCTAAARAALREIVRLGGTAAGRGELARRFWLCGAAEEVLPDARAAWQFYGDMYVAHFFDYAKVIDRDLL